MAKNLPCADCGALMWRTRSSLPEGQATCQPCRRVRGPAHGTWRRYKAGCKCEPCMENMRAASRRRVESFRDRHGISPTQKYRPRKVATLRDCEACGEPLRIAHPAAVWHAECRPVKFYAKPERRLAIYERDLWTCQLCLEPVDRELPHRDPLSATLDHIIPRSLGGDNSTENLRLAHLVCNSRRGNRVDSGAAAA